MTDDRDMQPWRAWLQLCAGLLLIWLCLTELAPRLAALPAYRAIAERAEARGIEPDALFYSELSAMGEIEHSLRRRPLTKPAIEGGAGPERLLSSPAVSGP